MRNKEENREIDWGKVWELMDMILSNPGGTIETDENIIIEGEYNEDEITGLLLNGQHRLLAFVLSNLGYYVFTFTIITTK